MPSVRALVQSYTSESVTQELLAAANAATPTHIIPRATVERDASGKVVAVNINLPTEIARADFDKAMASIAEHSSVATANPSIVEDVDLDVLPLGAVTAPITTAFGPLVVAPTIANVSAVVTNAAAEVLTGNGISYRVGAMPINAPNGNVRSFEIKPALTLATPYKYGSVEAWFRRAPSEDGIAISKLYPAWANSRDYLQLKLGGSSFFALQGEDSVTMHLRGQWVNAPAGFSLHDGVRVKLELTSSALTVSWFTAGAWQVISTQAASGLDPLAAVSFGLTVNDYFSDALITNKSRPYCMDDIVISLSSPV